jgi:hypothetical protein
MGRTAVKAEKTRVETADRVAMLKSEDPRLFGVGEMCQWLWTQSQVPPEIGLAVLRAWLGTIRRDVASDVDRSEARGQREGQTAEVRETLRQTIRRGNANLHLSRELAPTGWHDGTLEETLDPRRRHADVRTEISFRTDLAREELQPLLETIAAKLVELQNGRFFEPLGRVVEGGLEGFQINLWKDYLLPRKPGAFTQIRTVYVPRAETAVGEPEETESRGSSSPRSALTRTEM